LVNESACSTHFFTFSPSPTSPADGFAPGRARRLRYMRCNLA
jgi:hypothetical protein